jgi:RimJ/RimL family protein N-acetyltransferase
MTEFKGRLSWLRRRSIDDEDVEREHDELAGGSPREFEAPIRLGALVCLRRHVPENRAAFQRWYADLEIARLLRHDQRPLNDIQSRGYFDTIILPMSARGTCYAIHEMSTNRLIGTTALTDFVGLQPPSALFRIVIGEKDCWGKGYGTEATRLVVEEAFERHLCGEVRLEVFRHNQRAIAAYERVGFRRTGSHVEWVGRERFELHVIEMAISREEFRNAALQSPPGHSLANNLD